ncbi:MAG: molybdopterin-dependent oxidoreductase, partial [Eggerthellaceae bacterium]|nr:molybdopterin-dependent oxidoreductase [Eggerthellaceae bacterium]
MSEETAYRGISRRSFLKTSAVAAGATALAVEAASPLAALAAGDTAASGEEKVIGTFCRGNCGSFGCPLNVHVREGKVVNVTAHTYPNLADPVEKDGTRACGRGYSNILRLYAPERLSYPLRRVEGTERGDGKYERITWEEAIKEISTKWNDILSKYGPGSVARWTVYGALGWVGGVLGFAWSRLANSYGFGTVTSGADEAQIYGQNSWVNVQGIGSDGPTLAANAKNIVMWGQNPAETLVHQWRWIIKAKQNGAKLITIDPRVSLSASKSDVHIAPRYATDSALTLGLIKYLIDNGLADLDFVAKRCNGANLVREDGTILRMSAFGYEPNVLGSNAVSGVAYTDDKSYVWDDAQGAAVPFDQAAAPSLTYKGEAEGFQVTTVFNKLVERVSDWTVAKTCEVCGITEAEFLLLADVFANGPTTVTVGNGAGHYSNSYSFFAGTLVLTAISGNFYKPGAGWSNSAQFADFIWVPDLLLGYLWPLNIGPSYASIDLPGIVETKKYHGTDAPLRSLLIHSANPIANTPNRKAMIKAFKALDFVVVADIEMSETCNYADIILPVGHWFEVEEIGSFQYIPFAIYGGKAVEL